MNLAGVPMPAGQARDGPPPSRPGAGAVVAPRWRLALLAPAGVALLAGMASGLERLELPLGFGPAAGHGPLLALGFLGTVIALERAVAAGRAWAYLPVLASAAGALAIVAGAAPAVGGAVLSVAGLGVVGVYARTLRIQPALHLAIMALGAAAWPLASALWAAGASPSRLVPLLAAFLV